MFAPPPEAELPPPYTAIASPVINCRVCQSVMDLDGKLHQHVVKCTVCNEAMVSLAARFDDNAQALTSFTVRLVAPRGPVGVVCQSPLANVSAA